MRVRFPHPALSSVDCRAPSSFSRNVAFDSFRVPRLSLFDWGCYVAVLLSYIMFIYLFTICNIFGVLEQHGERQDSSRAKGEAR